MLGCRAAAAADDADPKLLDHLAQITSHLVGCQWVDGQTVDVQRQPGVGDHRDRPRRVLAEIASRLAHVLRPGRAVQTDDVDRQRFQDGQCGGDVGAQQHATGRVQRHLGLDRNLDAGLLAHAQDGMHRGLQLEDVLRRLDDEEIAAAVSQPADLVEEEFDHVAEAVVSQERVF